MVSFGKNVTQPCKAKAYEATVQSIFTCGIQFGGYQVVKELEKFESFFLKMTKVQRTIKFVTWVHI